MATMREVAARAGVSLKTVSRVFNDDPHVSPEVRSRVQQALADTGYRPNDLAQVFRSGRGRVVGVAVPDLVDPFYGAVVATIGALVQERGYGTLVTATGFDPDPARAAVSALLGRSLAGLVLAPVSAEQVALVDAAVPVVLVDQPAAGAVLDSFLWEDLAGGLAATRHLLGHGFRRIGFLGRAPHLATTHERLAGHRQALAEVGIATDERLVVADVVSPDDAAAGYARLRRAGADAVLCADPRTTIGCLPAFQREPLALVGFGDFPLADLLTPSVTVVDQDPAAMGRRAAERLLARIDGADGDAVAERLPVRLVERDSCRVGASA